MHGGKPIPEKTVTHLSTDLFAVRCST